MSLYILVVALFGAGLSVIAVGWSLRRMERELVRAREDCERAWSNIDVLLQRRHDEVGNLVDIAGQYMSMERDILEEIMEARNSALEANTPSEQADAEVTVRDSIAEFYTISEEYPELRTDEKFGDVRDSLQTIEGRLENRREYYNEAVMRYNATLERVPERYIAARRGYEPREPFEASEQANDDFSIRGRLDASEDR